MRRPVGTVGRVLDPGAVFSSLSLRTAQNALVALNGATGRRCCAGPSHPSCAHAAKSLSRFPLRQDSSTCRHMRHTRPRHVQEACLAGRCTIHVNVRYDIVLEYLWMTRLHTITSYAYSHTNRCQCTCAVKLPWPARAPVVHTANQNGNKPNKKAIQSAMKLFR